MCVNGKLIRTHRLAIEWTYPRPHVLQTEGSQIGDHRLCTKSGVVERPDYYCGDDHGGASQGRKGLQEHSSAEGGGLGQNLMHILAVKSGI